MMKNFKNYAFIGILLACTISLTSCGGQSSSKDTLGKEYTSTYVCPMHCEGSGSEEKGKCPVCGMDYVKNEEHSADGHQHNE